MNDVAEAKRLAELGVDTIITDVPRVIADAGAILMLRSVREALRRKYITLEGPHTGQLMGDGDPSAISFDGEVGERGGARYRRLCRHAERSSHGTDAARKRNLFPAGHLVWQVTDPTRASSWTSDGPIGSRPSPMLFWDLENRAGTPVVVCGLSLGALLATHLAATYPERVAGLIAMSNATWLHFPSPGLSLALCDSIKPFGNRFYLPKWALTFASPRPGAST